MVLIFTLEHLTLTNALECVIMHISFVTNSHNLSLNKRVGNQVCHLRSLSCNRKDNKVTLKNVNNKKDFSRIWQQQTVFTT